MLTGDPNRAGRRAGEDRRCDCKRQAPPSSGLVVQPACAEEEGEHCDRGGRILDPVDAGQSLLRPTEPDPRQEKRDQQTDADDDGYCVGAPTQPQGLAPSDGEPAERGDSGTSEPQIEAVCPIAVGNARMSSEAAAEFPTQRVNLHRHGDREVRERDAEAPER